MGKRKRKNQNLTKNRYVLTYERKEELKKELQHLTTFSRNEVKQRIKEENLKGNLLNKKVYDVAKDEQRKIEERIQETKEILQNAKMTDKEIQMDVIVVGSKLKLHDLQYEEYMSC